MLKIKNETEKISASFIQSVKEVKIEDLETLTKDINIPDGKAILCMLKSCNLAELGMSLQHNKKITIGVACLLAKINDSISEKHPFAIGDIVNIATSDLERAVHLHINTVASYDNLCRLIRMFNEKKDIAAKTSGVKVVDPEGRYAHIEYVDENGKECKQVYSLEFKIVDIYSIASTVSVNSELNDPFCK